MNKVILKRMKGLLGLVLAAVVLWQSGLGVLAAEVKLETVQTYGHIEAGTDLLIMSGSVVFVDGSRIDYDALTPWTDTLYRIYQTTDPLWLRSVVGSATGNEYQLTTTDLSGFLREQATAGSGHTHELKWRTTIQPTETTDGMREYGCECGHVEKSQVISFIEYVLEKMVKDIEAAKKGATIRINCKLIRCLTDEVVEALLVRPDVALELNFQEGETAYTVSIPAGKAPTDGQQWYGVFYLGSLYGYSRITPVEK